MTEFLKLCYRYLRMWNPVTLSSQTTVVNLGTNVRPNGLMICVIYTLPISRDKVILVLITISKILLVSIIIFV